MQKENVCEVPHYDKQGINLKIYLECLGPLINPN